MRALRRFFKRLVSRVTKHSDEERLRAEIEDHLARQTAENIRSGIASTEARRQAVLKFGGVEAMKESYREQKGLPFLEAFILETRHALRRLRLAPAFSAAVILTLALGIGATTSIFTLVHAVLMKSLPVANPDELWRLGREIHCCYIAGYSQDHEFSLVSYDLYRYLKDNTRGFSELAAFPSVERQFGIRRAGSADAAQAYPGEFVSGNYFAMFGITPYAGRALSPDDDRPGAPPVAVMSYRLWEQKYGADPSIIGSVFNIDEKPVTLVGVTPPGFFGDTLRATPPDFFLPLNSEPVLESDADLGKYNTHWLGLIGRIRSGASPASVEAEMRGALKQWLQSHSDEMSASERAKFPQQTLFLVPGGAGITSMREHYQHWLQILMALTAFVLLIVCANVANLMLVRGMSRRRQMSLSMALGASTTRLVSQSLVESIVLSLLGGAAGLAVAYASARSILRLAFPAAAGLAGVPIDAAPSMPVLVFALATSLGTGVVFGIAPACMVLQVDPIEALRGAGRAAASAGSLPRKSLVALQAALSLVLLIAAGLLTAALQSLEHQDFGFEQERRLVASIDPRLAGYRPAALSTLYRRIHDSIAGVPGVASVALCLYSPQGRGGWGSTVWLDGHPALRTGEDGLAAWDRVTPGYFEVVGTPIVKGRGFSEMDTPASRHVAVVSQAFARKFFGSEDPIGRRFGRTADSAREFEIVGVVKDARYLSYDVAPTAPPLFFLPEAQAEYNKGNLGSLFLRDIVILTQPGAKLSTARIQHAVASVNAAMPVTSIQSLRDQVEGQFTQQRLIARLTSLFGLLSLILASMGVYGVTAYIAGRRVNEIGVRIALGARRVHVIRLVLRTAFRTVLSGVCVGLPLAFVEGRLLRSQLYGVDSFSLVITLAAVLTLAASALVASFIPAFRASLVSPSDALRTE